MLKYFLLLFTLFVIILCITPKKFKETFKARKRGKNIYKSKLKYLDTEELNKLCNKIKDNDNNISIMMFNKGHIEEALNCIYTYNNYAKLNNIIVIALDNETKIAMDKKNIPCYYHKNLFEDQGSDFDFGSTKFNIICYLKLLCIYSVLKTHINVLWIDTDIVVFKNPFEYFQNKCSKSIIIQNDSITDNNNKTNLCAGFMYFTYDKISMLFLEDCINYINKIYPKSIPNADQGLINKKKKINDIDVLPIEIFPNGKNYFDNKICNKDDIYIIHNNWIKGLDNKVKRFKENDLWFI